MLPHCCFPVCSDVGVCYINLKVCCLTVVSLYVVMWGLCYINLRVCSLTVHFIAYMEMLFKVCIAILFQLNIEVEKFF